MAVVPVFGVAAALVPVSASAAGRTAITAASVMVVGAPARAASPLSPAGPAAASSNFWDYETNHRDSSLSEDNDYDYSAKMTHEMEKVARKALSEHIKSAARYLALLAAAIAAFVSNHAHAARIVAFVATVLAVANIKTMAAVWKWLKGVIYRAKHKRTSVAKNGFWARIFTADTSPPRSYQGWKARSCSTDAIRCGSPGDHNKENWP